MSLGEIVLAICDALPDFAGANPAVEWNDCVLLVIHPVYGSFHSRPLDYDEWESLNQKVSLIPLCFNDVGVIHPDDNMEAVLISVDSFQLVHGRPHGPVELSGYLPVKSQHLIWILVGDFLNHVPSVARINQLTVFVELMLVAGHEPCSQPRFIPNQLGDLLVMKSDGIESTSE